MYRDGAVTSVYTFLHAMLSVLEIYPGALTAEQQRVYDFVLSLLKEEEPTS